MNQFSYVGLILLLAFLAVSCASNKPSGQYEFSLVSTEDMSKRFTYGNILGRPGSSLAERAESGGSAGGASQRSGSQAPRQAEFARVSFAEMREDLEEYMAVEQYCTDGYFIYNETFDGRRYLLHGECQESRKSE